MSAAAKVKLTPAESFALLAQASKLVSLTVDRGWASDIAAQVAFLSLSAYHDWIHDGGGKDRQSQQCQSASGRVPSQT